MRQGQPGWPTGSGALDDPPGPAARQDRADGHAQLVDQAHGGELAEQVRAALGEDLPVAPAGQRADRRRRRHLVLAADDHVGAPGYLRALVRGRGFRGDHDGAGPGRGPGQQRALRVQVQPRAQHRDGRGARTARAQRGPARRHPGRAVRLGPGRTRADQDHAGERPQQSEDLTVRGAAQAAGEAVHRRGAVGALDHVGADPRPARPRPGSPASLAPPGSPGRQDRPGRGPGRRRARARSGWLAPAGAG